MWSQDGFQIPSNFQYNIRMGLSTFSLIYRSLAAVIYLLKLACFMIGCLHTCVVPLMLHQNEVRRVG